MRLVPEWLTSMVRFGFKGGVGVLVNLGLLTMFVDGFGVDPQWAVFGAWAITLVPGYLATDKWVFNIFPSPDGVVGHSQRGGVFYAIMWGGKALNYGIYLALLHLGLFYQGAWFVGAIAVFPITFGFNYVVWKFEPSGVADLLTVLRRHSI